MPKVTRLRLASHWFGFAQLGDFVCRRPRLTIALSLAVTAALSALIPSMEADFSGDLYLLPDDDTRRRYDDFRERFGFDERTIVVLPTNEIFESEFLTTLRDLHREIEDLPHVDEVTSLINARWTRGEEDELVVDELMETWPESRADLASLRRRVQANPLYFGRLLSRKESVAAIAIKRATYSSRHEERDLDDLDGFDGSADGAHGDSRADFLTPDENVEFVDALRRTLQRYRSVDRPIHTAGSPIVGRHLREISAKDTPLFIGFCVAAILGLLFALFRSVTGALLPLTVVITATLSTFGLMVLAGFPFTLITQILPSFLITVGVCDSVHLLTIFHQERARGKSRRDAIVAALEHSGLAILITSLTTAAGLLSFTTAAIQPVVQLGIVAAMGIGLALIYSITLLPALLTLVPDPLRTRPVAGTAPRLMRRVAALSSQHPFAILVATTAIFLMGIPGVMQLRFSHDPLGQLLPGDPVRTDVELIENELPGVARVEVLIDTGRENGLHEPDTLRRIDRLIAFAHAIDGPVAVETSTSILDIIKETNRALHANLEAHYDIPSDSELVAQELLLFENSGFDDLTQVTDSQFRTARVTLGVTWTEAMHYEAFLKELSSGLRSILGENLSHEVTGQVVLEARVFSGLFQNLIRSYGFAFVVISPLLLLVARDIKRGLLAILVNVLPIYLTLAMMGWLGITLNMMTLLVGSIVLGLAVDDTIHIMHKYRDYWNESGDTGVAIERTLETTGSALLVTSAALAIGFSSLFFAGMSGIREFGALAFFGTISAFLVDVFVGPALLMIVARSPRAKSERESDRGYTHVNHSDEDA